MRQLGLLLIKVIFASIVTQNMTIVQRRLIYSLFFLAFFVSAPLLILYASGYRLDIASWRISKVGALYIKTYPAGAKVYRNDIYTKRKTPTQIVNMPTGKQVISVIKDGYQTWSKTLRIEAGKTTFVEDIVLFKDKLESKKLANGGNTLLLSPDEELVAYIDNDNKLTVANLTTATVDNSISLPAGSQLVSWSQDQSRLAYQTRGNWSIVDTRSQKIWPLATYVKSPITTVHFGPANDDVWVITNGSLWRINLLTGKKTAIASGVKDVALFGESVARLTADNHILMTKTTVGGEQDIDLATGDYRSIADYRNDIIVLQGASQFTIWKDGQLRDTIAATHLDWRKNKILLTNGYDIWRYDTSDQVTTLLDRTGSNPSIIRWHPSQSYIAEVVAGQIQIIELDNRGEKRHVIDIGPLAQGDYVFDPKGEKIFILTDQDFSQIQIQ